MGFLLTIHVQIPNGRVRQSMKNTLHSNDVNNHGDNGGDDKTKSGFQPAEPQNPGSERQQQRAAQVAVGSHGAGAKAGLGCLQLQSRAEGSHLGLQA